MKSYTQKNYSRYLKRMVGLKKEYKGEVIST